MEKAGGERKGDMNAAELAIHTISHMENPGLQALHESARVQVNGENVTRKRDSSFTFLSFVAAPSEGGWRQLEADEQGMFPIDELRPVSVALEPAVPLVEGKVKRLDLL